MKTVKDKTITKEELVLDNTQFINCKFVHCQFVYAGGPFDIKGCDFKDECRFTFTGAALNTGKLLQTLGWKPPSGQPKIM